MEEEDDDDRRRGCGEQRRVRVCERSGDRRELERCRTCVDSTGTGRGGGWREGGEIRGRSSVSCLMIDGVLVEEEDT